LLFYNCVDVGTKLTLDISADMCSFLSSYVGCLYAVLNRFSNALCDYGSAVLGEKVFHTFQWEKVCCFFGLWQCDFR